MSGDTLRRALPNPEAMTIVSRFDSVPMTAEQLEQVDALRALYKQVEVRLYQLGAVGYGSRGPWPLDKALEALEVSAMWANKAISRGS